MAIIEIPFGRGNAFQKEVLSDKKKAKQLLLKFLKSARSRIDSIELEGKEIPLDNITEEIAHQWWKEWFK